MYKILNILLLICISFTSYAKNSPDKIIQALPSSIGKMTGDPVKSYANKTLGVSKGYNFKRDDITICATVYIFDMGAKHIPDGINSNYVRQAYKYAKIDIDFYEKKGAYKNVNLIEETVHKTHLSENNTALSLSAKYKYIKQKPGCGTSVTSYIYVFAANDHFIKTRITMNSENKTADSIRENFIETITRILSN